MNKVVVMSEYSNTKEYQINENIDIADAAAKYGRTEDTVQIYSDNNSLIAYAVWKQGYNHYSFCRHPQADFPCEYDILR